MSCKGTYLKSMGWKDIDKLEPDDEPLSDEERCQLNSNSGFVTWEEAKRGFGTQVDLP